MTPLSLTISSSSALLSLKPSPLPRALGFPPSLPNHTKKLNQRRRIRNGSCRAELSHDAPFAVAIGACMLNSLIFPITGGPDADSDSALDSTDARFAVMGIISFIPYFNWLSWVFAWLDTGKRRYAVYALVYLAPYLRSNLSLSPEESWLPIASIVFCIIHIQLEAGIRSGDIQGFDLFGEAIRSFSSATREKHIQEKDHQGISKEGTTKESMNLPSAEEQSEDEIQSWGIPRKPADDTEYSNDDYDDDRRRKH